MNFEEKFELLLNVIKDKADDLSDLKKPRFRGEDLIATAQLMVIQEILTEFSEKSEE